MSALVGIGKFGGLICGILGFVQEHSTHSASNWLDKRYWIRVFAFIAVDVALVIVSLIQDFDDIVGRLYLLLAIIFYIISTILSVRFCIKGLKERNQLKQLFQEKDADEDNLLSSRELRSLLKAYPPGSFDRIRCMDREINAEKGSILTDIDSIALARRAPRSHLFLLVAEFLADWLAFTSSLILFRTGTDGDPVIIAQGVLSVFDITMVIHHGLSSYLSKYRVPSTFCGVCLGCTYFFFVLLVFAVAMSGFGITIALGEFVEKQRQQAQQENITSRIPEVIESPGFWTGFALTGAILLAFFYVASLYYILSCCGCVKYKGREFSLLGKLQKMRGDGTTTTEEDEDDEGLFHTPSRIHLALFKSQRRLLGKKATKKKMKKAHHKKNQHEQANEDQLVVSPDCSAAKNNDDPPKNELA